MTAEILCFVSLVLVFVRTRRSLGSGLVTMLAIGYVYGLLRANLPENASHFIFDAAVVGFYIAAFLNPSRGLPRYRSISLQPWVAILMAWPTLLFFIPKQDWAIQLVGLRGAIFFLPFLLIGARMEEKDFNTLVAGMAVLNIAELGVALWQFTFGIQQFFPHSKVTDLIYMSNDVAGGAYRIPATFVASASYGGMMAFTVPFLLAGWLKSSDGALRRRLLEMGLLAAGLGVFLSASRTAAILLAFSLLGIFTSFRLSASHRVWIVALLLVVGWFVAKDERLQRFMTLGDTSMVSQRIEASVNWSFLDMLASHPMGNGLGGGGTSIPYFLEERVPDRLIIENEYGLILIEEGVAGLIMWLSFVVWVLVAARPGSRSRQDYLARFLLWCAIVFLFVGAPMGTGLLTAIPTTPILLLACGWLVGRRREERLLFSFADTASLSRQQPAQVLVQR